MGISKLPDDLCRTKTLTLEDLFLQKNRSDSDTIRDRKWFGMKASPMDHDTKYTLALLSNRVVSDMYMCILYMYTYMCVYILHTYIFIYVCIHACVYIVYVYMCVHIYVCIYCMYIVCLYMYIYIVCLFVMKASPTNHDTRYTLTLLPNNKYVSVTV